MTANKWIEFVRKWAKDHDTTYGCAISQPACKEEYRAKYGNRKKLTKAKEKELMGMEDFPAPATGVKKVKKVKKPPSKEAKERFAMAQEDISSKKAKEKAKEMDERYSMGAEEYLTKKYKSDLSREKAKEMEERYSMGAEEFDTKRYNRDLSKEKAKELRELSRMMGEDYNAPKLVITEKAPAKKPRGRPKKYATAEEARTARIQKTTESNKRMAEMRKKYLQEARERIRMEKEDVNRQLQRQGIVVPAPSPAPAPPSANPIPVTFFDLEEALPSEAQVKKPINVKVSSLSKRVQSLPRELKREVLSYIREPDYFLAKIDKKELKRLILEWLDKYTKIRGKIDPKKKVWLNQEPIKIIEDYREMYRRYQEGIPSGDFPRFRFDSEDFTPSNLLKYIKDKTSADVDVGYKVGDIFLFNYKNDLVRIEKITPTTVTIRFDNKILEERSRGTLGEKYESGRFAQDFKGKSQTIKHSLFRSKYPEPTPSNFNYRWNRMVSGIPD